MFTKILIPIFALALAISLSGIVVLKQNINQGGENALRQLNNESSENVKEKEVEQITSDIDTSDWKTYRNEELGFEFKYPESWKEPRVTMDDNLTDSSGNAIVRLSFFSKDRQASIQGSYDNAFISHGSLDDNITYMLDRYPNFINLEDEDILNGKAYFDFTEDKLYGTQPTVTLIGNNHIVGLTYYRFGEGMNNAIIEFKNIISTFKFLD